MLKQGYFGGNVLRKHFRNYFRESTSVHLNNYKQDRFRKIATLVLNIQRGASLVAVLSRMYVKSTSGTLEKKTERKSQEFTSQTKRNNLVCLQTTGYLSF
jgi:hypothetical protein